VARCQIQFESTSDTVAATVANSEIRLPRLENANPTKQRPTSILIKALKPFFFGSASAANRKTRLLRLEIVNATK